MAVIGLVIAGIATIAIANDDDSGKDNAAQIERMEQGCQQWAGARAGTGGPDSEWCSSMAGWMADRMDEDQPGRDQMRGAMMSDDPDTMRRMCEQWMATTPAGDGEDPDTAGWCGEMVDWMEQYRGDWDGSMSNGPSMGNP